MRRGSDAEIGCTGFDVALLFFECVLGRMDADDFESVVFVGVVPVTDVRDGSLAVDAGVRPEVDEDDLAALGVEGDRLATGCVQPSGDSGDVRCGAAAFELARAVRALVEEPVLVGDDAAEVQGVGDLGGVCNRILQGGGVVGNGALKDGSEVEDEPDGQRDHEDPAGDSDAALVFTERLDAFSHAPTCEGEDQQRQSGSERERDGQDDGVGADLACGSGYGDRREHWSCAGYVDGAECESEDETASAGVDLALRDPRERLFE